MGNSRRQNNINRRKSRKKLGGSPLPITAQKVVSADLAKANKLFNASSTKSITIGIGKTMSGDRSVVQAARLATKQYYRLISIEENNDVTYYRVKTTKGNQGIDGFITTKPRQGWAKRTFKKAEDIKLQSLSIKYVVTENKCYVRFDSNDIYYANINAPSDKKNSPINNANIKKAIAATVAASLSPDVEVATDDTQPVAQAYPASQPPVTQAYHPGQQQPAVAYGQPAGAMGQPIAPASITQPSTSALTYSDHQAQALARRRYCRPLSKCNVGDTVYYQIIYPHTGTGHLVPATIQTKNIDDSVTVNIHPNRDKGQSIITVPKHDIPTSLITAWDARKRDYRGGGGSRRRHRNKNESRRRCQSRRRNRRRR